MNYFFVGTMMAMCSLHLGSCHNKQEPDCVLGAWMIKDPSTGIMVATNRSPFTFDTSAITILSLEQCGSCPFKNSYKVNPTQAILDQEEISDADTLYQKAIIQYNAALPTHDATYRQIDITKPYKRQYIAATLVNGNKEVWINAFCSNHPDWKKSNPGSGWRLLLF